MLLDTDVLSELVRPVSAPALLVWAKASRPGRCAQPRSPKQKCVSASSGCHTDVAARLWRKQSRLYFAWSLAEECCHSTGVWPLSMASSRRSDSVPDVLSR